MNVCEKGALVEYLQEKTEILGEEPAHKLNLGLCIENLATDHSVP
jgi:hypothetical protein